LAQIQVEASIRRRRTIMEQKIRDKIRGKKWEENDTARTVSQKLQWT
jgi:hypothetical protein